VIYRKKKDTCNGTVIVMCTSLTLQLSNDFKREWHRVVDLIRREERGIDTSTLAVRRFNAARAFNRKFDRSATGKRFSAPEEITASSVSSFVLLSRKD